MLDGCGCVGRRRREGGGLLRCWRRSERAGSMGRAERALRAAILIQRWYRRYLARVELRRRYTWNIFQSIEYAAEQDQAKLYDFFRVLLDRAPNLQRVNIAPLPESSGSGGDDDMDWESGSGGPDLRFPLQRRDVDLLIDTFRKKKKGNGVGVEARVAARILREGARALRQLPTVQHVSTALARQVTVCGDLHGQLDDLLVIFHKNGLPAAENPYVFNGDFVDRGPRGMEVLLLLLACTLAFPGAVHLNRGNHEDLLVNARYGFIKEVKHKYKHDHERLLRYAEEVYRTLPLASIIDRQVLVVHGGIADDTDLNRLQKLDRFKYKSVLRPPLDPTETSQPSDTPSDPDAKEKEQKSAPAEDVIDKDEWKQVFDLLWADPQQSDGVCPNELRGAGTCWGPDVTRAFLGRHGLAAIVRSHECRPDGFELLHGERVVTLFSASNYYSAGSNRGAYLKLRAAGGRLQRQFVQFAAGAGRARRLTLRQRVGAAEASALRELHQHVGAARAPLEAAFRALDTEQSGFISVSDWCWAMERGTRLELPWRMLKDKLVRVREEEGRVRYMDTFEPTTKMNGGGGGSASGATTVLEALYSNRSSLEAIFRILDKDNSGYISAEELSAAWSLLEERTAGAPGAERARELWRLLDVNGDGRVDINEFLESFRLADRAARRVRRASNSLV